MECHGNIGIGYNAGYYNVAIGYSALLTNTTGAAGVPLGIRTWYAAIKDEISEWLNSYKGIDNEIRNWIT